MIKLAYCNVENLDLGKAYRLLPQSRKDKVDRFRFMKDKKLSCGAYLLLEKLLSEAGITKPEFKLSTKRAINRIIKLELEKRNIEIPYTQIDVHTKK